MARITVVYLDIRTGYYPGFHHGLASLAGAVRAGGHQFKLIHLTQQIQPETLLEEALQSQPDIIGFSLTTNQKKYLEKYIKYIKPNVNVPIIVGGVHPTIEPDGMINIPEIDCVCIGEAEETLPQLLNGLQNKEAHFDMPGFWFKNTQGKIYRNPVPSLNPDLSKLPPPDYTIFNIKQIMAHSSGVAHMLVTRGCPYNCYYCGNQVLRAIYPNKKDFVRMPPVNHAIKLIKNNLEAMQHPRYINFDDDLLTFNTEWLEEFCTSYRKEIGLPFMCNGRVEILNRNTIKSLKEAGCDWIYIGIESGNEWVRKNLLNRHYSNKQLIEAFKLIKEYKIKSCSYNIIGFPFETLSQIQDTLNINLKVKPDNGICYFFYPYPKTRLYEICKESNLLLPESEKLTGYKEGPAIRLTNISKKNIWRQYYKIQGYFFSRAAITSARMNFPIISQLISKLAMANGRFLVKNISQNLKLKKITRKISYKYLFQKRGTQSTTASKRSNS